MSSPIAVIELAIRERLRTVARGYKLPLIESYGGQLDDETFEWIRVLPAVWVTFAGASKTEKTGPFTTKVHAGFEVLVAQRHLQENAARLNSAGDGSDVGVYQLLEDNKLALANRKLGLPMQPLSYGPIEPVMKRLVNREAIHVYSQRFDTFWLEKIDPDTDDCNGDLVRIGLNAFLMPDNPPTGNNLPNQTNVVTLNDPT